MVTHEMAMEILLDASVELFNVPALLAGIQRHNKMRKALLSQL